MYFVYEWVIADGSGAWVEVYKTRDKSDAIETFTIYQTRGKTRLEYVT